MHCTRRIIISLALVTISTPANAQATDGELYFPTTGNWETVSPAEAGWNGEPLDAALEFAKQSKSSGVVILHGGRILAEHYWQPVKPSFRYRAMTHGTNKNDRAIEDVASCQKSVVSILVGIAQEKKLININDPVHKYLKVGWSKATAEQESKITIRHLITMTSGLNDQLKYEVPAGTKWKYNTGAYSQSLQVVCAATNKSENEVTREWITGPLGMTDSKWIERANAANSVNKFGFATTARDLARFGLLIQAHGEWNGQTILADQAYLRSALTPSQKLNPSYGYLWWLNGQKATQVGNRRVNRMLIPTAPRDLVGAFGALSRKCYVVPSRNLIVTRLGDEPPAKAGFQNEFWRLLMKAAPASR